jgi:hypothetical protein
MGLQGEVMGIKLPPLQNVHKQTISEQMAAITDAYSDRRVAELIAQRCMQVTSAPYRFAINHDIRPPKNLACKLQYDWTKRDRVGIDSPIKSKLTVQRWLVGAALMGYVIYYVDAQHNDFGFYTSIHRARYLAQRARQAKEDFLRGDDIPF